MKRFLLKVLALFLCCLLILFALSPVYLMMLNTDYERDQDLTLKFKYVPESIDVAAFGSSHAGNGFQPPQYHDGTLFNFYMSMQSPVMDNRLYFHFRDHLAEHALVIIDLSYFSLYYNGTRTINNFKRYCTFLPIRELPRWNAKLYRLFRIIDFDFNPVVSFLMGKTAELTPFHTTHTSERYTDEELDAIGADLAKTFIGYLGDQTVVPEIDRALRDMLEDCIARGYRPVLVTTPYQSAFNQHIPDDFLATFRADCARYAKDYAIPYLDYSHDARVANARSYFVDTDHLTSEGSSVFMQLFFQDLKQYYPD